MRDCAITESVKVADTYGRMFGKGFEKRKKRRFSPHFFVPSDCDEYPYVVTTANADGGNDVLFNSIVDESLEDAICCFCGRRCDDGCGDVADDVYDRVRTAADICAPGKKIVIMTARRIPICVRRMSCKPCSRNHVLDLVFEGTDDMTDEQFEQWWDSLTTEQQEEQLAKVPQSVRDELAAAETADDDGYDEENDPNKMTANDLKKAAMSDDQVEKHARKAGASSGLQTAAIMATANTLEKKFKDRGAKKAAEIAGKKVAAKTATKAAAKAGGKSLIKSAGKKIPVVGTILGAGLAADRLLGRDKNGKLNAANWKNWLKAGGELTSGLVSNLPVIGTAASAAIDGAMAYDDFKDEVAQSKEKAQRLDAESGEQRTEQSAQQQKNPQQTVSAATGVGNPTAKKTVNAKKGASSAANVKIVDSDGLPVGQDVIDYYGVERLNKEPWLKDVVNPGDPDDENDAIDAYDMIHQAKQLKANRRSSETFVGGRLQEADENGGIAQSDSDYPIPQDELFKRKTYSAARNYINEKILPITKGYFEDEDWGHIHAVFDAVSDLGVNLNWGVRNDSFYSHGYHVNDRGVPDSKAYSFDIRYRNIIGKKMCLSGQVIACAAGTVEKPLGRYDIVFQLF